ncbi:DUF6508 domain-containing protein [Anaerobacillus sp. CMMVII]|uniref:DUF6508 domain-containing protein n=1 Tax=Anaerobacillus sp. CMMVII TaxID=2755588 RepID=UPI0021B72D3F|nr:DUF6508 domain-containing protein [Anaerobacillus sp. CMMVII]
MKHYIENLCHTLHASFYRAEIEKLSKFLPYFETATMESVCKWTPAEKTGEKQVITPYPTYDKSLLGFIDEIYSSNFMYTDYMSTIQDLDGDLNIAIETADLDLLRAILTYYVRAERFSDGAWAMAVEEKVFLKILRRLKEINKVE